MEFAVCGAGGSVYIHVCVWGCGGVHSVFVLVHSVVVLCIVCLCMCLCIGQANNQETSISS